MIMRCVSKRLRLLAAVLALGLAGHGADARPAHSARGHAAPAAQARAYNARGAYDASGAYGARAEEFRGTSVPYDPDGPGYNDFQLQGAN
jgi:hypothetical protein